MKESIKTTLLAFAALILVIATYLLAFALAEVK